MLKTGGSTHKSNRLVCDFKLVIKTVQFTYGVKPCCGLTDKTFYNRI